MAIFLGGNAVDCIFNGIVCSISIFPTAVLTDGVRLLSSEGYVLQESNGALLTVRAGEL